MTVFEPFSLSSKLQSLRLEVRDFLARELAHVPIEKRALTWSLGNPSFTSKVAARGWIGMVLDKQYGGHGRSFLERYVVLEEMLVAGAPVGCHWIADRQSAPLLWRFGTPAQKEACLPAIARGEMFFCIGMSEPNSGSDLASVQARAVKVKGGWQLNGTKLWTTGAQYAHKMIGLFRTSQDTKSRHGGLSQFLIDLKSPGVRIRPVRDMTGYEHFNEVIFDDVLLEEASLIGKEGEGWQQVTAELAYERSGPERYLSSFLLLPALMHELSRLEKEKESHALIGGQVAYLASLRAMSISVAGMLAAGKNPALAAAMVKDMGSVFEQGLPTLAQTLCGTSPNAHGSAYQRLLHTLVLIAPTFSLRGGTREILRSIISKSLTP